MIRKAAIAIVDDEQENLELLQRVLGRRYSVRSFRTAKEAIEALSRSRFAMLITDVMMPDMDGLDLARRAKTLDSSLIVLAVSGFTEMQEVLAAHKEGIFDMMIAKPWRSEEIKESVKRGLLVRDMHNMGT